MPESSIGFHLIISIGYLGKREELGKKILKGKTKVEEFAYARQEVPFPVKKSKVFSGDRR
jgi:hypothetical protein